MFNVTQPNEIQTESKMIDHQRGRREAGLLDNLKTGAKVKRRILLGKLPTTMRSIELRRGAFRRMLEAAILQQRDEITLVEAAAVSEASYWVSSCATIDWILRRKLDELSGPELAQMVQRQAHSMRMAKKVMESLRLDEKQSSGLLAELESRFQATQSEANQ